MTDQSSTNRPVCIVTGAGSGIGRAIAQHISRHARIVIAGRRVDPLLETGSTLGNEQSDWIAVQADITRDQDRQQIVEQAVEHFGRIDHLVNNAGLGTSGLLCNLDERQIAQLIDVNLTAPIALTRLAMPKIIESRGTVISIGSRAAIDPFPGLGVYGCAKSGIEGLARAITNEYGQQGVRSYTVHPGAVETAMLRSIISKEQLPTDQVLTPDDIAGVVVDCILGQREEPSGSAILVSR